MDEYSHLDKVATWYTTSGFYERLVKYGLRSIKPYFTGSSCLELGPADGSMTELLLQEFQKVTSVEGSSTYCKNLEDKFGHHPHYEIVHTLIEDFHTDSHFDTIIAAHFLEHVGNPVEVAASVKQWASNTSVFIIIVPNALSFHRLVAVKMGLLDKPNQLDKHDLEIGHRRVYDQDLLISHLEEAGWDIVHTGGIFFKPLTNGQIDRYFTMDLEEGFYLLGNDYPEHAAEIFLICQLPRS